MAIGADVELLLRAKFEVVLPHLDERAQRLVLAGEARSLGHGGIAVVARASGASRSRIAQGVSELDSGQAPLGRVRRPGGGRKPAAVADPGLVPALLGLVEPTRRGDPESTLCWTTLSVRKLAAELNEAGHRVSQETVAKVLRAEGFSLQANTKQVEGGQHPDRNAQFSYLNDQANEHLDAGQPVISVDSKKKELVGAYKNNGAEWRPAGDPERVKVHDFIDPALGKANPYGIYDLATNTGWVSVGTDHDTAVFAVNTIASWWNTTGRATYPNASRLLITADGGGSNGHRTRAWKAELAALATATGLVITVCHLPPGTSKWNKIEHRLFSHISMNWRARPLTSHDVIVNTIAATTTATGLTVHAELDTAEYPTGVKIPDKQMKSLEASDALIRHDWHGDWNYNLNPHDARVEKLTGSKGVDWAEVPDQEAEHRQSHRRHRAIVEESVSQPPQCAPSRSSGGLGGCAPRDRDSATTHVLAQGGPDRWSGSGGRRPAASAGHGVAGHDLAGQGVRPDPAADPAAGRGAEAYAAMDERRAIKPC